MLEQRLSGYCDYKKKIKYRLIPFVYLLFISLTISLFTGLDICAAQKPAVIEGKDKWLFFALDGSIADFQGKNHLSQQQMERYLTSMQELTLTGAVQGKEVYYLIPPNKEQVFGEFMPEEYPVLDTYKRLPRLVDYIRSNSDVKVIYPLLDLQLTNTYCRTYMKNDTHWSSGGAFVGMQALYQEMGMETTPLYMCARTEVDFPYGDLISMGNLRSEDYTGDFNYIINYKPEIECVSPQKSEFTSMIYWVTSSSDNPEKIVVIGDSFCMRMTPFLMKDFSECLVLHRNYIEDPFVKDFIRRADIIIVEAVERLSGRIPGCADRVKEILLSTAVEAE